VSHQHQRQHHSVTFIDRHTAQTHWEWDSDSDSDSDDSDSLRGDLTATHWDSDSETSSSDYEFEDLLRITARLGNVVIGLKEHELTRLPTLIYRAHMAVYLPHAMDSCVVCLDDFGAGAILRFLVPCRHCFHRDCIDRWLESSRRCPVCKEEVCIESPTNEQLSARLGELHEFLDRQTEQNNQEEPMPTTKDTP